jgi:hypothetical protein
MGVFPFDRPKNYNEMLNKIGLFTFLEAIVLTLLIPNILDPIRQVLYARDWHVKVMSIELPLLVVLPGVAIALFARIIRLHDKLSDLFRIRQHFDVSRILLPLAKAVGYKPSEKALKALKTDRKRAMRKTFYRYASFEEPAISKALVLSAIDSWTWYWVLLEFLFLLVITASLFLAFHALRPAFFTLAAFGVLLLLFLSAFPVCARKASNQIEEIVSDPKRAEKIRLEFAALLHNHGK